MYETEIARGVAALNQTVPNWHERVSLHDLDMMHPHRCVLGQVFGHYYGDRAFDLCVRYDDLAFRNHQDRAVHLGFDTIRDYAQLTDEWRVTITRLRFADTASRRRRFVPASVARLLARSASR